MVDILSVKLLHICPFSFIYLFFSVAAMIKRSDDIIANGNAGGRGRPKLTWDAVVKKDMNLLSLTDCLDQAEWRKMIHVAQPQLIGT